MFLATFVLITSIFVLSDNSHRDSDFEIGSTSDSDKYCDRTLKASCHGRNCVVSGKSKCVKGIPGAKITNVYYIIRSDVVPFISIGRKEIDVGSQKTREFQWVKSTSRFSLAVVGLFEYHSNDAESPFDPDGGDYVTEWYPFVYTKAKGKGHANFGDLSKIDFTVGQGKSKAYRFRFSPDFTSVKPSFPKFEMSAFVTEDVIIEKARGKLKGMVVDPNSLKLSMNISNCGCTNTSSTGIGILMFLTSETGTEKRSKKQEQGVGTGQDYPNQPSPTNDVWDVIDKLAPLGGYVSFKTEIGEFDSLSNFQITNSLRAHLKLQKTFTSTSCHNNTCIYLNETQKNMLMINNRHQQAIWLSVPRCDLLGYYWDPNLGFDGFDPITDQERQEDADTRHTFLIFWIVGLSLVSGFTFLCLVCGIVWVNCCVVLFVCGSTIGLGIDFCTQVSECQDHDEEDAKEENYHRFDHEEEEEVVVVDSRN